MTPIGLLNFVVLQWFGVRLGAGFELRAACQRVCSDTDWCPVCERHPSSGHDATCALVAA